MQLAVFAAFAAAGLIALAVGLWGVRLRGRKEARCRRCDYALEGVWREGVEGQRCPECGSGLSASRKPRRRVVRRPVVLAVGLVASAAFVPLSVTSAQRVWASGNVYAVLPNGWLRVLVERGDGGAYVEAAERIAAGGAVGRGTPAGTGGSPATPGGGVTAWRPGPGAARRMLEASLLPFESMSEAGREAAIDGGWTEEHHDRADLVWALIDAGYFAQDADVGRRVLEAFVPYRVVVGERRLSKDAFVPTLEYAALPGRSSLWGEVSVNLTGLEHAETGQAYAFPRWTHGPRFADSFAGTLDEREQGGSRQASRSVLDYPAGAYRVTFGVTRTLRHVESAAARALAGGAPGVLGSASTIVPPGATAANFSVASEQTFEVEVIRIDDLPRVTRAEHERLAAWLADGFRVTMTIRVERDEASGGYALKRGPTFGAVFEPRVVAPDIAAAAPDIGMSTVTDEWEAGFPTLYGRPMFSLRPGDLGSGVGYSAENVRHRTSPQRSEKTVLLFGSVAEQLGPLLLGESGPETGTLRLDGPLAETRFELTLRADTSEGVSLPQMLDETLEVWRLEVLVSDETTGRAWRLRRVEPESDPGLFAHEPMDPRELPPD